MYSKFFQHSNADLLETQLDTFLKELEAVTEEIVNMNMFQRSDEIIVLVIYSCWKKL